MMSVVLKEQTFCEGKSARGEGLGIDKNPHIDSAGPFHIQWRDGWSAEQAQLRIDGGGKSCRRYFPDGNPVALNPYSIQRPKRRWVWFKEWNHEDDLLIDQQIATISS